MWPSNGYSAIPTSESCGNQAGHGERREYRTKYGSLLLALVAGCLLGAAMGFYLASPSDVATPAGTYEGTRHEPTLGQIHACNLLYCNKKRLAKHLMCSLGPLDVQRCLSAYPLPRALATIRPLASCVIQRTTLPPYTPWVRHADSMMNKSCHSLKDSLKLMPGDPDSGSVVFMLSLLLLQAKWTLRQVSR
jgi:hypothetical protein